MKNGIQLNDEKCTEILAKYLAKYTTMENLKVVHCLVQRTCGFDIVHELHYTQMQVGKRIPCLTVLNEDNYTDLLEDALHQEEYDLRKLDYRYDKNLIVTESAQVFPRKAKRKNQRHFRSTLMKVKK